MISLILDIGNTRAKVAVVSDRKVLTTKADSSPDALDIDELCTSYHIDAAIASVVGVLPDFSRLLPPDVYGRFHLLSHNSRLPIAINYATPSTLGMDRVAAVVGARQFCPQGALVVVDAGSCITVDLLDTNDVYQGGAILPGLSMRLKALNHYTASLPLVNPTEKEWSASLITPVTGKSTRDSIMSGVFNATLFEIDGYMQHYQRLYPDVKLFLTGGDAVFFARQLFFPNFANPDLIWCGLHKILEINL